MEGVMTLRFVLTGGLDLRCRCTADQRDAIMYRIECGHMVYIERDCAVLRINPRHIVMVEERADG